MSVSFKFKKGKEGVMLRKYREVAVFPYDSVCYENVLLLIKNVS